MNRHARKTALRMTPCGVNGLTADHGNGNIAGATVNWVTQTMKNLGDNVCYGG